MGNLHENTFLCFVFEIYMKAQKHVFMYFLHLVPPLHHNGKGSIRQNPVHGLLILVRSPITLTSAVSSPALRCELAGTRDAA